VFERFHNRTARVAVVGLGYVGLPLAVALAASGYEVVGIDLDPAKNPGRQSGTLLHRRRCRHRLTRPGDPPARDKRLRRPEPV